MLTTTCALVLACVAFAAVDFVSSRQSLQSDLTTLAAVIGANSAAALTFSDNETAVMILGALRARPSVVGACIYTSSGTPFAVYQTTGRSIHPLQAPPTGTRFRNQRLEVTRDIYLHGERIGRLFIASNVADLIARMKRYALLAGGILLASLLLALILSSRLQQSLVVPILDLATIADRVRHGRDYTLRASTRWPRIAKEIEMLTSAFNDMLAGIQMRDSELQRHRNHLEAKVQSRTSELRVANGELVTARDAAQRIADENARLGRHKHRILNTVAEGLFELDSTGAATFINRAAAAMLGSTPEELIGRSLHTLIHGDDHRRLPLEECRICQAVLGPTAPPAYHGAGHNIEFVSRTGASFPVEFNTSAMPSEGGAAGVVVTFRDITERLVVERMKDEFVSTVSHELRTPLTSIRGSLGLLGSGLLGPVPERAVRMLEIALTNTDRLVRLINDILDLEKMSAQRVELHRAFVAAPALMEDAVSVIQTLADKAGVTVTWDCDATILWADPDSLVQALTNLLGNAVKFSSPGTNVRMTGAVSDDAFVFRISDQGRGIPAENLESIFERFKQVDSSDSRDKGGSGLGLAICRSIATAHDGTIRADSVPGEGSTFSLMLPLAPDRTILPWMPAGLDERGEVPRAS